jgi:hypothetical protein
MTEGSTAMLTAPASRACSVAIPASTYILSRG